MSTDSTRHPLEYYPENEQVAYLSILAAICYADKEFSAPEKQQLDALLTTMNISDEGKGKIYASVFNLQHEQKRSFLEIIQNLNDTDLKFTLISDLCLFALADSKFSPAEYAYIIEIGKHLHITREQVDAIRTVQKNLLKIKDIPPTSTIAMNILKEGAAGLAGVGVPVGAIAVSGSVFGLNAAGIASGLAALGALVGGGMVAGAVVVVPAIAAGAVYGVKKLLDLIW